MGIKVCKFGGSSLADAAHFQRVRDILFLIRSEGSWLRARPASAIRRMKR